MKIRKQEAGASMVEILVTLVIIAFGLLGMAGLQMRLQVSEVESYQRSQALLLLNDMASRIATNRNGAASYVTGTTSCGPRPTSRSAATGCGRRCRPCAACSSRPTCRRARCSKPIVSR